MSNQDLAKDILKFVGGNENVTSVVSCVTQLRFQLRDHQQADKAELEKLPGVLMAYDAGEKFRIVLGIEKVADVYQEIVKSTKLKKKQTQVQRVFDFISRSLSPVITVFAGAGMIKALLAILTMLHWLSPQSGTYFILAAAGNSVFYFLPIMLGITCSMALGANPYIGGAIGAALLEPNFTGLMQHGSATSFLGIPVLLMSYSSTIFPIFIAIPIYAVFEKFLRKIIFKDIQLFMVSMLSLIIIVPLTAMVFGPFGIYVGHLISVVVLFLFSKSGFLAGAVLGASWTFLTIVGLHWALIPIVINDLAHGGDPLIAAAAAGVFAQMGMALGVFLKTKDKNLKSIAGAGLLPAIFSGETSPILYGVFLRFRRTFLYVAIAGAVGGAISGGAGVKSHAMVFPSFLSMPVFAPLGLYIIGMLVAFVGAAVLTMLFGYENKNETL